MCFGKLKEVVDFAYNIWLQLSRYTKLGNGHINIDSNEIEKCFYPGKLGLKNFMFIGHPKAGWVFAMLYSVVGYCRLMGVNPEEYIRWVLRKVAAGTNLSAASGLPPHDFAALALEVE